MPILARFRPRSIADILKLKEGDRGELETINESDVLYPGYLDEVTETQFYGDFLAKLEALARLYATKYTNAYKEYIEDERDIFDATIYYDHVFLMVALPPIAIGDNLHKGVIWRMNFYGRDVPMVASSVRTASNPEDMPGAKDFLEYPLCTDLDPTVRKMLEKDQVARAIIDVMGAYYHAGWSSIIKCDFCDKRGGYTHCRVCRLPTCKEHCFKCASCGYNSCVACTRKFGEDTYVCSNCQDPKPCSVEGCNKSFFPKSRDSYRCWICNAETCADHSDRCIKCGSYCCHEHLHVYDLSDRMSNIGRTYGFTHRLICDECDPPDGIMCQNALCGRPYRRSPKYNFNVDGRTTTGYKKLCKYCENEIKYRTERGYKLSDVYKEAKQKTAAR